jgi:Flp pilus assembly protein TadB
MVFHPEDHGGKQMKSLDLLFIGVPMVAGIFVLLRFFQRTSLPGAMVRIPETVVEAHRKAHAKLVEGRAFSLSGGMLVTSLGSWLAGEAVGITVTTLSLVLNPSLSHILFSILLGICLGCATLFLSLRRQANRHVRSVRSSLPVASFLLSLLLEAGMGSHSALQEVARAIPNGPLARELEEITRARTLGISREAALERSRRRVPVEDYHIFLNLVSQGERLGVGLSRGLRDHSSKMLEGELYRAEATAQKAAVKLLFPLVAFIFPAVALIIFSPIILNIWEVWWQ